jgi:uncharacterized protein YndB with AHSA1/START domain
VNVRKDPVARTMTVTTEFAAPVDRVWQLWADPRQLERWWGPPTHPATVVRHELKPGGRVTYYVTGPDGDRMDGWWDVTAVEPPHWLSFVMGDPTIPPLTVRADLVSDAGRTRMVVEVSFPTADAMDLLIGLGFEQGLTTALGQIDQVL